MLSDRDMLTDCLLTEKHLAQQYLAAADHIDDPALLQTIMNICTDEQQCRLNIYELMNHRGWYNPAQADAQTVSQSIQNFQQTQQQLQRI